MKPRTELFNLVKSLSPNEKRFLSRRASADKRGKDMDYLRLFRILNEANEYDESVILNQWAPNGYSGNFSSTKNYLQDHILQEMGNYHQKRSLELQLRKELNAVQVLQMKGQATTALRLCRKVKRKAAQYEKWLMAAEAIGIEIRLERAKGRAELYEILTQLATDETHFLKQYQLETQLKNLYDQIYCKLLQRTLLREEEAKQELEAIFLDPLLDTKTPLTSHLAQQYRYLCHIYAGNLQGELDHVLETYRALIALWESRPDLIKYQAGTYMRVLLSYLDSCASAGQEDEFGPVLEKVNALPLVELSQQAYRVYTSVHLRLRYYMSKKDYPMVSALAPETAACLKKYATYISISTRILFWYAMAQSFFVTQRYSEALYWVNELLYYKGEGVRENILSFARILSLVLHLELGNHSLLQYQIRSSQRYLKKRKGWLNYEKAVVNAVKKCAAAHSGEEQKAVLTDLREVVLEIPGQILGRVELLSWLEFRLSNG